MILLNLKRTLLALFVFILPLLLHFANTSPVYTKVIFAIVAIDILTCIWLLDGFRYKTLKFQLSPLALPAVGLMLIMGISTYNSLNIGLSMEALFMVFLFFVLYLFIVNHTESESDLYLVVGSLLLSIAAAAGYGLFQYFALLPGHPNPRLPGEIMLSSVGNKNFLGELLVFLVYPTLMFFLLIKGSLIKFFFLGSQVIMMIGLILIDSDATWFVLAGSTVIWVIGMVILRPRELLVRNKGWILTWLIVIGMSIWFTLGNVPWASTASFSQALRYEARAEKVEAIVRQAKGEFQRLPISNDWNESDRDTFFESMLDKLKPSLVIRLQDWSIAWKMFLDFPLIGSGLSNYALRFLPYKRQLLESPLGQRLEGIEAHPEVGYIPRAIYAHNDYLQIAAELGLLGLILSGLLLLAILKRAFYVMRARHGLSQKRKFIFLCVVVSFIAVMLDATVGFPLHAPSSAMLVAVLLGIIFSPLFGNTGPILSISGVKRWIVSIVGLTTGFVILGISVLDFQADLRAQEGIAFYTNEFTHLGARLLEQSLDTDVVPKEAFQYLGDFYASYASRAREVAAKCVHFNKQALLVIPTEQGYLDLASCYIELDELDLALNTLTMLVGMDAARWIRTEMLNSMDRLFERILAVNEEREANWTVQRLDQLSAIAKRQRDIVKQKRLPSKEPSDEEHRIDSLLNQIESTLLALADQS